MRVLTFSGVLLDTGEMQLEPGFVLDADAPSAGGEVTVEALDRVGRPLASTQVPIVSPCGYPVDNGAGQAPPVAVGLVAFPEKASGLRVVYEGKTVLERQAPKAAGEPQVEWPGALDGAQVTVSWRIRAKEARASLGYSNDGGDTWTPVSLPTAERSITFDARGLPGGTAVLELLVSDGSTPRGRDRPSTRSSPRAGCCGCCRRPRAPRCEPASRSSWPRRATTSKSGGPARSRSCGPHRLTAASARAARCWRL